MFSIYETAFSLLCVLISAAIFHHLFFLRNESNEPPLIKGQLPFLGCAIPFQRDMKSFLLKNRAKYGGIFSIYVAGQRIHIISDPVDGVPTHFRNRNFGFKKFAEMIRLKQFLNTEEEVADDSMSNSLYALLGPYLLSNQGTTELVERMTAHLQPVIERLIDSLGFEWKEIDLIEWCNRMVFELSNIAFMGPTFPKDDELYRDLLQFEENLIRVWKFPIFLLRKEQALSRKLIDRMQKAHGEGMDMSMIMQNRIKVALKHEHEGYIPKDILTFAWASLVVSLDDFSDWQTNAMPTLFWFLAYMHLNSQQSEFLAEVKRYTTTTSSDINISNINFSRLLSSDLLKSGLKETLRLQAHNLSPRNLEEDTTIHIQGNQYLLRKGSLVFAPSTLVNYDPDIYEDPEKWKADRFVEKDAQDIGVESSKGTKFDAKNLKFPLLIWGGGAHVCPGRRFATNEILIMLSISLLYFEIAPIEGDQFSTLGETAKDQYGMGVKAPMRPWKVKMRARRPIPADSTS